MKPRFCLKDLFPISALLLLVLFTLKPAHSQTYTPIKLEVTAEAISDGTDITIRWVPEDYETWKWGQQYGYRLERTRVDTGATNSNVTVLDSMILPMPAAQWQPMKDTNDMAKVAYKMIFEDSLGAQYFAGEDFATIYEAKQARESMLLFFLIATDRSFEVAEASGLAYIDDTAVSGAKYLYSITPNSVLSGTEVVKGVCEISTDDALLLPPLISLSGTAGDHVATVGWDSDSEHYNGYMIERSDDNGTTWQPVNESPYLPSIEDGNRYVYFGDSLDNNTTSYVYRVKGCTPFGTVGPVSDTVHIMGKPGPLKDAYPNFIEIEEVTTGELTLNWEFPLNLESEVQGFDIYRAKKQEGYYKKMTTTMLPVTARSYVDANPLPANYYKVVVKDKNGHELASVARLAQPEDTSPPSPPASVTGVANLSGTATLNWTRSPEADVKGYRVFISNQPDGGFTQITTTWINDTIYRYGLNLNTLSEEVYFIVKAIDFRENMSDPSPVCTVQRPDIIPPAPPSIDNVVAEPKKVHFEWDLSSSEDVVEHEFQRKPNGGPGWVTLLEFDTSQQILAFTDSTASFRKYWDYRLLARDDAGLLSSSDIIKTKPGDDGVRFDILNLNGYLVDGTNRHVVLEWDYDDDLDLTGFQIYRSFDSNPMQSYKFIPKERAYSNAGYVSSSNRFAFIDDDLDFSVPVQTVYTADADVVTNTTVVTGGTVNQNGNVVTVVPLNPNVPQNPQNGVTVNYWIMAKHFDGGFSPLTQVVAIQVN